MKEIWKAIARKLRGIAALPAAGKPAGVWLAWGGLLYAMMTFREKLEMLVLVRKLPPRVSLEFVTTWLILVAAASSLSRRLISARIWGGMAMTLLYFHALFHGDAFGMVVAALSFLFLLANRRWFDERLPPEG